MNTRVTMSARPRPAWRWNRALEIVNGGKPRPTDDAQILQAVKFWKMRSRGAGDDRKRDRWARAAFPVTSAAYELFRRRQPLRWAIEALIAGGSEVADIASEFGTPESVIQMYISLFYDVLNDVKSRGWTVLNLTGDNPDQRDEPGYALLLKKLAVLGGPQVMVDSTFKFFGTVEDENLRKFTEREVRKRLAVASHRKNFEDKDFAGICPRVWVPKKPEEKTMFTYLGINSEKWFQSFLKICQRHVITPSDPDPKTGQGLQDKTLPG